MWTDSFKNNSYITLTVHYINEEWVLVNRVLFTTLYTKDQKTGKEISELLKERFTSVGLCDNLFQKLTFITDRGSNIVKALQNQRRMDCMAHALNTVLRNSFSEQNLNSSNIQMVISNAKYLVTHFKRTGKIRNLKKTLHQSVDTRWNSIYAMLNSIYDQLDDVKALDDEGIINDWDLFEALLGDIISLLRPFVEATKDLECDRKPTLHKVLLWRSELLTLSSVKGIDSSDIKVLKCQITKFIYLKINITIEHKIALFLCPAYKHLRCLTEEERNEVLTIIKQFITACTHAGKLLHTTDIKALQETSRWTKYTVSPNENAITHELDLYMATAMQANVDEDLLHWWYNHQYVFPNLAKLARQILNIPATSTCSERNFSSAGRVMEARRTRLAPSKLDQLLFLHSNEE